MPSTTRKHTALLDDDQRGLRHQHLLIRLVGLDRDADELPVNQRAIRIGHGCAHQHGIGGLIHRHIDEVDPRRLVIARAIRKADTYSQRLLLRLALLPLLDVQNTRWLTGNVTYIGSRLTSVVSTPLSGPTTFPLVSLERPTSPLIGATMSV